MRKWLCLFMATLSLFTFVSCKKQNVDPGTNDNDASLRLQGKWIATQQSGTINGQPNGKIQYFNEAELMYEFNEKELKTYHGNDPSYAPKIYTWKVTNGELILRKQYGDSATVYKLSFNGNNGFSLTYSYVSGNDQIVITNQFLKK